MKKLSDMSREEKAILWTVKILNGLRDKGLVEGGCNVSEEGVRLLAELEAEGFKITTEEVANAMAVLRRK